MKAAAIDVAVDPDPTFSPSFFQFCVTPEIRSEWTSAFWAARTVDQFVASTVSSELTVSGSNPLVALWVLMEVNKTDSLVVWLEASVGCAIMDSMRTSAASPLRIFPVSFRI